MKTTFIIFSLIFSFLSCQKVELEHSENSSISPKFTKRSNPWHYAEKYYNDCEGIPWCSTPPTDCKGWYTIPQSFGILNAISTLDDAISEGKSAIADWFTTEDADILFSGLHEDDIENLQSGDYLISKVVTSAGDIAYLIAEDEPSCSNHDQVLFIDLDD